MPVVVSDASPIRYLVLIGEINLLNKLYGEVLIPTCVAAELTHRGTPASVREWVVTPPSWISIHPVTIHFAQNANGLLDPGEQDAILLALQTNTRLVLMDDREGVHEARRQGLEVTGTLGILDQASVRGILDLPAAIAKLRQTNFRAAPSLIERLLAIDAARNHTR